MWLAKNDGDFLEIGTSYFQTVRRTYVYYRTDWGEDFAYHVPGVSVGSHTYRIEHNTGNSYSMYWDGGILATRAFAPSATYLTTGLETYDGAGSMVFPAFSTYDLKYQLWDALYQNWDQDQSRVEGPTCGGWQSPNAWVAGLRTSC
jgi:hypothetical protein